ncbi:MAG: hydroxymethylbilane synthase [Deltaproteobacteria bacterium GWB2_55_19]|nr:MAG: hydroxymethylbilane synthase [Deltaproteobacteria bacterium GWB2_55_19]HAO93480.1 hydroxymethylbilane synthase [Deltaproteobacteria bacterium]
MKKKVIIGTRGSALALWQANWVKSELEKKYPDIEVSLTKIKTTGDKILDVPLAKVGGKGLFVKEIEEALLEGRVHLAVHSMKDVPTFFPDGLHLRCITEREDPRDAVFSRNKIKLLDLPKGAKIGTSSLRRQSQLLHLRPDFEILQLRGNLDTRLKKLDDGHFDAIILAGAGVKRLGWADKITELLSPEVSLPAIGQGALGIETPTNDAYINDLVAFFDHPETSYAVRAERALLKRLEGGCQVPIAAYGTLSGETLTLKGLVASPDGKTLVKDALTGPKENCEKLGVELAERLLKNGAYDILKDLYQVPPPGSA